MSFPLKRNARHALCSSYTSRAFPWIRRLGLKCMARREDKTKKESEEKGEGREKKREVGCV